MYFCIENLKGKICLIFMKMFTFDPFYWSLNMLDFVMREKLGSLHRLYSSINRCLGKCELNAFFKCDSFFCVTK